MFQKFVVLILSLFLFGCASEAPIQKTAPTNLTTKAIQPAKKVYFVFEVALELQNEKLGSINKTWRTLTSRLMDDMATIGIQADYKIDTTSHFLVNEIKVPDDVTHVVILKEVQATRYAGSLIDIHWDAAVHQLNSNHDSSMLKPARNFEQISNFKYTFAGWSCFAGMNTKEQTDECVKNHSTYLISTLKTIGVL